MQQALKGGFVLKVEVEGELTAQKRREIEELLRDYHVNYELKEE